jgi:tetratricopeptide (TPR) repeat protein
MNLPLFKEDAMSHYPSSPTDPERPRLGRVVISLVGALVVLVAVGVAVVQIGSNSGDPASSSIAQQSSDSRSSQPGTAQSDIYSNERAPGSLSGSDGSSSASANDPKAGGAESGAVLEKAPEPMSYAEAERLYHARDYASASVGFASYVEEHPENVWGHFMLGLSLWKGSDLEGAEAALMRGLDRDPNHLKSLINLARVRIDRGRFEPAILPAERAASLAANNAEAQRVHARALHSAGRARDAALAYSRTLQIAPDDVWALNNLGLLWIEQEEFALALPPLARAAQLDSSLATVQNNLGIALERSGCFRAATEAYARALGADSSYVKTTSNRLRAEALIVTQSVPDPDLAAVAASFVPTVDTAALPAVRMGRPTSGADSEDDDGPTSSSVAPADGAGEPASSVSPVNDDPMQSNATLSAERAAVISTR